MHLTIAMLTYRRNDYLAQVIPELLAQADDVSDTRTTASVLIVDNDPQAGARAVVEAARVALGGEQPEASEPWAWLRARLRPATMPGSGS